MTTVFKHERLDHQTLSDGDTMILEPLKRREMTQLEMEETLRELVNAAMNYTDEPTAEKFEILRLEATRASVELVYHEIELQKWEKENGGENF